MAIVKWKKSRYKNEPRSTCKASESINYLIYNNPPPAMERDYYLWSGYYLYKYFVAAFSLLFDKSVVSPTLHIATIG